LIILAKIQFISLFPQAEILLHLLLNYFSQNSTVISYSINWRINHHRIGRNVQCGHKDFIVERGTWGWRTRL